MGRRNFPVISIGENTGARALLSGNSSMLVPTTQSGLAPKYCLVTATPGTAPGNHAYASPTIGATSGTSAQYPFFCDRPTPVIMLVHGHDRISTSRLGDDTSYLYVIPLEDF